MLLPKVKESSGIYIIICRTNLKFYIGSSCELINRFKDHKRRLIKGKHLNIHLQHAWNRYGAEQFTWGVLEYCPIDLLLKREQYYLDIYKPFKNTGFNILINAEGRRGHKASEETKKKIGDSSRGKKRSREVVRKMHKWRQEEPERAAIADDRLRISFTLLSPNGEIVEGRGVNAFAKKYNLSSPSVGLLIKGKIPDHKGWSLPSNPIKTHTLIDSMGTIYVIKRNGVKRFAIEQNLHHGQLWKVLNGKIKNYKGWSLPSPIEA